MSHSDNIFVRRLDILMYLAFSDHAVTTFEIMENVTELEKEPTNKILRDFNEWGFVVSEKIGGKKFHLATEKTKQIFGTTD